MVNAEVFITSKNINNFGEVMIYNVVLIRYSLGLDFPPLYNRIVNEEYLSIVLRPDILHAYCIYIINYQ